MGKRKQKFRGSSSSESDDNSKPIVKCFRGPSGGLKSTKDQLDVSDILRQSRDVLYEHDQSDIDSSLNLNSTTTYSPQKDTLFTRDKENCSNSNGASSDDKMTDKQYKQNNGSDNEVASKLDALISAVNGIQKSQDGLRKMFESKLDKLRTDLMENIDGKVRALRDELSIDLARESERINQVLSTMECMQSRLCNLEQQSVPMDVPGTSDNGNGNGAGQRQPIIKGDPINDPNLTIMVYDLRYSEGENLEQKVNEILQALGDQVSNNVLVTAVKRLPSRIPNRPGLVKISLQNIDEKVLILRNKWKLKDSENFKRVFLKSSKSHAERLIELNTRAILRHLPGGNDYRIDANGRIRPRTQPDQQTGNNA